jgi:hypothetical protein
LSLIAQFQHYFALQNIELIRKASPFTADNNGDDSDTAEPGSKRQHTQVGRIPKGEDFWGRMDKWFVQMIAQYGRTLSGPHWKEWVLSKKRGTCYWWLLL